MANVNSYYLYQKYEKRGDQPWIPVYPSVYSVDGDGTMPIVIKEEGDPSCPDPQYRTITTGTTCNNANKYVLDEYQVSYDEGNSWYTISSSTGTLIAEDSYDCGYRSETVTGTPYCEGYDKYVDVYSRQSRDYGDTWITSSTSSVLVQAYSYECGYIPPSIDGKYLLILNDGSGVSAECDSTSAITSGEVASKYDNKVVSAVIGNCVKRIETEAFWVCKKLGYIRIPNSVTTIGNWAFAGCPSLTSIEIPSSVETIGHKAFGYCVGITSIEIPSSVTSIGLSVFGSCDNLSSITVDNSNTVYDSRNNCNAIIETNTNKLIQGCYNTIIPNTVTCIGQSAFEDCHTLTNIEIPSSVTSIEDSAFEACYGITSIEIPSGITYIDSMAFSRCYGLTSVTIPNSVTQIYNHAFASCYSLISLNLPSGLTDIGMHAFWYCYGFTSLELPSSLETIDMYGFYACSGLTSITCYATTPPYIGKNTFDYTNECPIYVPAQSVRDYKSNSRWLAYWHRIQAIPT